MSVSPPQNRSKPPPVPEMPTVTLTPECSLLEALAAACDQGPTVVEPSTSIGPERPPPLPARPRGRVPAAPSAGTSRRRRSRRASTAKSQRQRNLRLDRSARFVMLESSNLVAAPGLRAGEDPVKGW